MNPYLADWRAGAIRVLASVQGAHAVRVAEAEAAAPRKRFDRDQPRLRDAALHAAAQAAAGDSAAAAGRAA